MQKRAALTSIKALSSVQIFLLISMSFAFSFILGQEISISSAAPVTLVKGTQTFSTDDSSVEFRIMTGQGWTVQQSSSSSANTVTQAAPAITALPALVGRSVSAGGTTQYVASQGNVYEIATSGGQYFHATSVDVVTKGSTTQYVFKDAAGKTLTLSPQEVPSNALGSFTPATASASAAATSTYAYNLPIIGTPITNYFLGNFIQGVFWAAGVAGMIGLVANLAGANSAQAAAISKSVAAGIISAKTAIGLFGKQTTGVQGSGGILGNWLSNGAAGFIGIGVAVAVFITTYKKESQKLVTFQCMPWEPKLGGEMCEECNKDPLRPCSEYRCKALGQACQLLNPNTNQAQCAWVSKGDVTSPTIQEWAAALKPTSLQYTPANAIRPGARGISIVSQATDDNCLPAFTNLQFGILTNEPAQCKIDYNRSINFDRMQYYFGESNYYQYNHTQRMRLPAPNSADTDLSPLLQNDGTFALFVRCRDANGNVNEDEYSINFCVSEGPDTTPPIIESTSLEDGSPVRFGADVVPIEVYTNEPAECKWSTTDRDYAEMENTLRCAADAAQINADLQYTCAGNLTGVQNSANKEFFFRCIDQPGAPEAERNEMRESYKLSLRGTQELSLLIAGPNATTIQASTNAVSVELFAETDDGADEGVATCYFSPTGSAGSYLEFYETDAVEHKQALALGSGNYTYYMRCVDAGGNSVNTSVQFGVGVDKNAPMVTRVYRRSNDALQITTNENAQCTYSKTSCNFNLVEGLPFNYADANNERMHLTEWKAKSAYYIKCKDQYGNEPSPNSCSIVVSGVDLTARAVI